MPGPVRTGAPPASFVIKFAEPATERVSSGAPDLKHVTKTFVEYSRLERKRAAGALSPRETERWAVLKAELDASFGSRTPSAERRSALRVPMRLECSYDSLGRFEEALITNLSHGGVFIPSDAPLPIGEKIRLRITIDETGADLEVDGVVVSHHVGPAYDTQAPGFGVRFSRVRDELRAQLDEICRRQLERAGDEPDGDA